MNNPPETQGRALDQTESDNCDDVDWFRGFALRLALAVFAAAVLIALVEIRAYWPTIIGGR